MSPLRVLVTGAGGPAGRSLARRLVARGVGVVAVDMAPFALPGATTAAVPPAGDPALVPMLRALVAAERVDLVVPTVTEELPLLAGRDLGAPAVLAAASAVALAHDKWLTHRRLLEARVATPASALAGELPSGAHVAARLGEPWLRKPRVGRGARGVAVHARAAARDGLALGDGWLLQAYAPGAEYAVNLHVPSAEGQAVAVVLEKTALARGKVGNGVEVRRVDAPEVASIALAAARALGLTGPLDVDVRRAASGAPLVLEVNARFGAHHAHAPEVLDAVLAAA